MALPILGVVREDVGTGRDYKQAATDAFKRLAVRFGIANELYGFGPNWVELDGDGKHAKPVEDPAVVYARRNGATKKRGNESASATSLVSNTAVAHHRTPSGSLIGVDLHARKLRLNRQ